MKAKIKSYGDEAIIFYDTEIPKVDSNDTYLVAISLDSALNKDGNCYLQMFLKDCKYIKKTVIRHMNDNFSDFCSSDESDE